MKIQESIHNIGIYKVVKKLFLRNQQNVEITSFYANDTLFKRDMEVRGNHIHKLYTQLYDDAGKITEHVINFMA